MCLTSAVAGHVCPAELAACWAVSLRVKSPQLTGDCQRTLISAWDDERIRATGRSKLIFGAIGTNVCLTQATIGAIASGYQAYAAIDLSGASNELLRSAAIAQMTQAGVGITTGSAVIFQILHDNTSPLARDVYTAMGPLLALAP